MLSEKTKKLTDYQGFYRQSSIDFELDRTHIRKKFILEYCDDAKKLERLGLTASNGGLEIDDVYHRITFTEETENRCGEAFDGIVMTNFLRLLFRDDIYDVKLYEQIVDSSDDDCLLQERWIEFPSTFYNELRSIINKDLTDERDRLRKENEELSKVNENMQKFIDQYRLKDMYSEFRKLA